MRNYEKTLNDALNAFCSAKEGKHHDNLNFVDRSIAATIKKAAEEASYISSFFPQSEEKTAEFSEKIKASSSDNSGYFERRRGRYGVIIND